MRKYFMKIVDSKKRKNLSTNILILIFLVSTVGCSSTSYSKIVPRNVTGSVAGENAYLAMMSSNTYHKEKREYFPIENIGWQQFTFDDKPMAKPYRPTFKDDWNGLAYNIYKKEKNTVFAYRGTDGFWDWIFANLSLVYSPAYSKAFKMFKTYKDSHPTENIIVTGHSLGGGIALGVSVRNEGVEAVVFDPSPRIFNGLENYDKKAERTVIYQEKEILETVRKGWTTIPKIVSNKKIYKSSCDFKKKSNHRGDLLAKCLLRMGMQSNKELIEVGKELKF
jgi:hypothetical protein